MAEIKYDQVYVKKMGTNNAPIFNAQVISPNGTTAYKQVQITNVRYVSPSSQSEITQYIINNASSQSNEELTAGAQIIAQRNFDKERTDIVAAGNANGSTINYTEPSTASKIWDTINPFSANFLGIDRGPKPDATPNLVGQANLGDKSISTGSVKSNNPVTSGKDKKAKINTNVPSRDIIGGSDMAVFFILSYPAPDLDNLRLPKDQQNMEHIIIELDNTLSLSYQTIREVFPVRNMGSVNPSAHLKGIRTISGNIAFTIFTNDPLTYIRSEINRRMKAVTENFNVFVNDVKNTEKGDPKYKDKVDKLNEYQQYFQAFVNKASQVQLLDNMNPFTILVMGTNENGLSSKLMIKDVSIVDENQYQGTQQPHAINKVTFTATDIIPMAQFEDGEIMVTSVDSVNTSFINGTWNSTINYNNEVTGTKALDSVKADFYKNNRVGG